MSNGISTADFERFRSSDKDQRRLGMQGSALSKGQGWGGTAGALLGSTLFNALFPGAGMFKGFAKLLATPAGKAMATFLGSKLGSQLGANVAGGSWTPKKDMLNDPKRVWHHDEAREISDVLGDESTELARSWAIKTQDLFKSPFKVGADSPFYVNPDDIVEGTDPNVFKFGDLFSEATKKASGAGVTDLAITKAKPSGLNLFAALHGSDYGRGDTEKDLTFEQILNRSRWP